MLSLFYPLLLILGQDSSSSTTNQTILGNDIVDEFIYQATESLVGLQMETFTIPSLSIPLNNQKLGPFTITGTMEATNLDVFNVTHIERKGDSYISTIGKDELRVTVNLHIEPMTLTFKKLKFNLGFLSNNGPLRLESGSLQVGLEIALKLNDETCKLWFDKAEITDMDKDKIVILPDNVWNKMKDAAANAFINANFDDVKSIANQVIKDVINSVVEEINPCQYLPS